MIELAGSALTTNSFPSFLATVLNPSVKTIFSPGFSDCWLSDVKIWLGNVGSTALKYHAPVSMVPWLTISNLTAILSVDFKVVVAVNSLLLFRVP